MAYRSQSISKRKHRRTSRQEPEGLELKQRPRRMSAYWFVFYGLLSLFHTTRSGLPSINSKENDASIIIKIMNTSHERVYKANCVSSFNYVILFGFVFMVYKYIKM